MPLIYSRPGHTETTKDPSAQTELHSSEVRVFALFEKARTAGATDADIEAGIAAAEAAVTAILRDRAEAAIVTTAS